MSALLLACFGWCATAPLVRTTRAAPIHSGGWALWQPRRAWEDRAPRQPAHNLNRHVRTVFHIRPRRCRKARFGASQTRRVPAASRCWSRAARARNPLDSHAFHRFRSFLSAPAAPNQRIEITRFLSFSWVFICPAPQHRPSIAPQATRSAAPPTPARARSRSGGPGYVRASSD